MEYNKESFKKALKKCGIIRWENHFEKVVKAYLEAEAEQLTIPVVVERLPIGTVVTLIDSEGFKGIVGEQKITGYCNYMGEPKGYLVNGEGIFLDEDFVR